MSVNERFRDAMAGLAKKVKATLPKDGLVAVAGCQRRGWLFSSAVAYLAEAPHIAIYRDGRFVAHDWPAEDPKLQGARIALFLNVP